MSRNLELDIRLILLGRSGEGKSALSNLILGYQKFKTGATAGSVTHKCESSSVVFNNRKMTVTDTPGLFDTQLTNDEISTELTHSYYETAPGPHAFLIVTSGRYTTEAEDTLILLVKLFGESVIDYCIVAIRLQNFDVSSTSAVAAALLLIQKQKLTELLECIDDISRSKQTSYYTHELFDEAARDKREQWESAEQRMRFELDETEIRLEENNNLQQREEETKKKRAQQEERLEAYRSIERYNRTTENGIADIFGSLLCFTLKIVLFVAAMRKAPGNRHLMGYQHFRSSDFRHSMFPSFTQPVIRDTLNDYLRQSNIAYETVPSKYISMTGIRAWY